MPCNNCSLKAATRKNRHLQATQTVISRTAFNNSTAMAIKSRRLGLYAIIVDGDYGFLKWNKTLLAFKYMIDVVPLDEFERNFGILFGLEAPSVQRHPISFTDGARRWRTVYISREFQHRINTLYPQFVPLLEKGYVVLLKTFKRMHLPSGEQPNAGEVMEYLLKTYEFCQHFKNCLQLTIGDFFKPGAFFGCMMNDGIPERLSQHKRTSRYAGKALAKKGNYFLLELSR
jgi:hypothetical protein